MFTFSNQNEMLLHSTRTFNCRSAAVYEYTGRRAEDAAGLVPVVVESILADFARVIFLDELVARRACIQ